MRLPKWLDRERSRMEALSFAAEKGKEARFWFERWQKLGLELAAARAERDIATEDRDAALKRVGFLESDLKFSRTKHDEHRHSWRQERDQRTAEIRRLERELAAARTPLVSVKPDDRAALYRLEEANERLRHDLDAAVAEAHELRVKYEGNPS